MAAIDIQEKLRLIERAVIEHQRDGGGAGHPWDLAIFDAGYEAALQEAKRKPVLPREHSTDHAHASTAEEVGTAPSQEGVGQGEHGHPTDRLSLPYSTMPKLPGTPWK